MDRIVIVGAGLAGGRAAVELRAQGFTGSIVLLGAEEYPPYDRPPLSKGVLPADEVVVDEHLASSWSADGSPVVDGPPVVGDCAAWWSRRYDRRLRVEHWDCAQGSPAVAATTLLGGEAVYDPVPYFWPEQFGRMVQVVGLAGAGDTLVWRGDPGAIAAPEAKRAPGWSVGWFAPDGRLPAIATVNRPMDAVAARRLIAADAVVDAERFADLAIPLKDLATTA